MLGLSGINASRMSPSNAAGTGMPHMTSF
jgi:hypothetical protein